MTLTRHTLIADGTPGMPLALMGLPLCVLLPPAYASLPQLSLASVGAVLLAARLWDMVSDPLIGWVSDRVTLPPGRRRRLMLLGVPLLLMATWFLFNPEPDADWLYLMTLPPLVAFAIYFGLLHSLSQLWRVALTTDAQSPREQVATLLRKALPASTVTWLTLLAAWMLPTSVTAIEATIQVICIVLAALTLPHGLPPLHLRYLQRQSAGLSTRTAH